MIGLFEHFECHCEESFWISPEGKVITVPDVVEHDSVASSIIEDRYKDEFCLIDRNDFRRDVCNFLMVKGWIKISSKVKKCVKYSRWSFSQPQIDIIFDITRKVFD